MTIEGDLKAIEEEFVRSWDFIVPFYIQISRDAGWLKPLPDLIAKLRGLGYDRKLRAGAQLATLIFSRSRAYGLRTGQPRLKIDFPEGAGMHVVYLQAPDVNIQLHVDRIELTPEVEELLARLVAQPID